MEISSHDQKNYRLMLESIADFRQGQINLMLLIQELEILTQDLEHIVENWKNLFYKHWLGLEIVYSLCLDEGRSTLTEDEKIGIEEDLKKLEDIVKEKIIH